MMWLTNYPAKRLYEFFMGQGYMDFDDVLKYTKLMLSGTRKLMPLDGFFDKEKQVFVIKNLENDRFLCLFGIYDKKMGMFSYSQAIMGLEDIKSHCMLEGSIQLMYWKMAAEAL